MLPNIQNIMPVAASLLVRACTRLTRDWKKNSIATPISMVVVGPTDLRLATVETIRHTSLAKAKARTMVE